MTLMQTTHYHMQVPNNQRTCIRTCNRSCNVAAGDVLSIGANAMSLNGGTIVDVVTATITNSGAIGTANNNSRRLIGKDYYEN